MTPPPLCHRCRRPLPNLAGALTAEGLLWRCRVCCMAQAPNETADALRKRLEDEAEGAKAPRKMGRPSPEFVPYGRYGVEGDFKG